GQGRHQPVPAAAARVTLGALGRRPVRPGTAAGGPSGAEERRPQVVRGGPGLLPAPLRLGRPAFLARPPALQVGLPALPVGPPPLLGRPLVISIWHAAVRSGPWS